MNTFNMDKKKVLRIKKNVEADYSQLNEIIQKIINPYCESLDDYVEHITDTLSDSENLPTNEQLEAFCMNLSTHIYWAGSMVERLGIKDDISRAIYKEVYNTRRDNEEGTVADKNSLAELASQQEYLTNVCYNRAYKIMKAKVENAQELLSSCKKVLSHRMQEMELTRLGGNS